MRMPQNDDPCYDCPNGRASNRLLTQPLTSRTLVGPPIMRNLDLSTSQSITDIWGPRTRGKKLTEDLSGHSVQQAAPSFNVGYPRWLWVSRGRASLVNDFKAHQ